MSWLFQHKLLLILTFSEDIMKGRDLRQSVILEQTKRMIGLVLY